MNPQKLILLDIAAGTEATLRNYMEQGYVILHLAVLSTVNKLLVVYAEPFIEEG